MDAPIPSTEPSTSRDGPLAPDLLVVDLGSQGEAIASGLRRYHRRVVVEPSMVAAEVQVRGAAPDAVVIDAGDRAHTLAAVRAMRARTSGPVLVVNVGGGASEIIALLDGGADDALAAPLDEAELLARLRVALRRTFDVEGAARRQSDELVVDLDGHVVRRRGATVHLTRKEWGIVELLVRNTGRLVGREELLRQVWGPDRADRANYLRVYLTHIRRKLEDDPAHPRHFVTVNGMGYRYEP